MKTTFGICCALALALVGCGNSNGGGTGTTGGSSGTTTSGSICRSVTQSCSATQACCAGLSCDANGACAVITSGASTSGSSGTTSGSGDTCTLGAAGSPCVSTNDCKSGLLCLADAGGSFCNTGSPGLTTCTENGEGPSASSPCCASVDAGAGGVPSCSTFETCALTNNPCTTSSDCCDGLTCDSTSNTCVAACGAYLSTCTTNADCCADQGLFCTPGSIFTPPLNGSFCVSTGLPAQTDAGGTYPCAPLDLCAALDVPDFIVECQLGAACDIWVGLDAGGFPALGISGPKEDPCAPVGLVCDTTNSSSPEFGTCVAPSYGEDCLPGGTACQAQQNTTTSVDCLTTTQGAFCAQPCKETSDCANPQMNCYASDGFCYFTPCGTLSTGAGYFSPCASSSTDDGVCMPLPAAYASSDFPGTCQQATTVADAGGPGSACSVNATRQIGGLCDNKDFCNTGICGAVCNAGTGSDGPGCPSGQKCASALGFWKITDATDPGGCVIPCDITMDGGNSCGTSSAGVAMKCFPSEFFDYGPTTGTPIIDFCSPLAPNPLGLGAACAGAPAGDWLDACAPGLTCFSPSVDIPNQCYQMCEDNEIGKSGPAADCPTDYTCTALTLSYGTSTHTAYCAPPAGATNATTTASSTAAASSTGGASSSGTTSGAATGATGTGTSGAATSGSATGTTTG